MTLPACPNGKCRCWCGLLAGDLRDLDCREMPSRIAELAACNDAPLDLDKQLCQRTLHDLQEDLQTVDSHIEYLESILSALKTVRKKTSSLARSCRSILNPIRSLPTEILSKIFSDVSSSVDLVDLVKELEEYFSLDAGQAPWTLARVSARWRQTAQSTPRIWSRIGVTQTSWCYARSPNLLCIQLQLSKSSPLIVAIDWHFHDLPQDMVEILFPSSPRWETLVLSQELDPQLRPLEGKLPSLRILLYGHVSLTQSVTTSTFAAAPKLRTLYVPNLGCLHGLSHLPLSQITTFSTMSMYLLISKSLDLYLLARLTALQQCSLDFMYFPEHGADTAVFPLILPNLRILRVGAVRDLATILGKLILPALKVLSIHGEDLETLGLAPFVQRSQCILKELHLESRVYMSTVEDITIAFEKSPSLERLTLHHEIVAVLASRIDLLPSLQALHVTLWLPLDLYLLQFVKDAHPELVVTYH